jgi:hypothetical protein
LENTHIHH